MKAVIQHRYGSADETALEDVEKPRPADDELLLRVHAASVNAYDLHFMKGVPYIARYLAMGASAPKVKIRGRDVAGTVEAVGAKVTGFAVGDEVYGETPTGSFAEYARVPAALAAPKPANLSFAQAAAVPLAAITALQALRDGGGLKAGQKVLVNGASGGVGTFAVQIAKALGAAEVTAVCSTRNVDQARALGADHVIDYTREDFTANGRRYDVILDNVPLLDLGRLARALTPTGVAVQSGGEGGRWVGPMGLMIKGPVWSLFSSKKVGPFIWKPNSADLAVLTGLIEKGEIRPVIERTYPLAEAPAALRQADEEHARAKIVVTVL